MAHPRADGVRLPCAARPSPTTWATARHTAARHAAATRPAPRGTVLDTPARADELRAATLAPGLALGAIFLAALNLRPTAASLGPVLPEVREAVGMSSALAGLLTTLPPVCFGLAGTLAARLDRRLGTGRTMVAAMAVLALGLAARPLVDTAAVFVLLTVPALAAMGIGNILLPVAVKRWFPDRVGRVTGVYSLGLVVGTAGAAAATVPIAVAAGTWRVGLASWALPAALACALWMILLRRASAGRTTSAATPHHDEAPCPQVIGPGLPDAAEVRPPPEPRRKSIRSDPRSWALAGFFGLQGLSAYTLVGWLPSIYQAAGLAPTRAALMLTVTVVVGAPLSVLLPVLAARRAGQRVWPVALAACAALGYGGLLWDPAAHPLLWALLLGMGMGAFPLALLMIGLRAHSDDGTAQLSSLTQGLGYAIAATGPVTVGLLHDATQGWTVPLLVLLSLLVPQAACGVVAGRAGHVDVEGP